MTNSLFSIQWNFMLIQRFNVELKCYFMIKRICPEILDRNIFRIFRPKTDNNSDDLFRPTVFFWKIQIIYLKNFMKKYVRNFLRTHKRWDFGQGLNLRGFGEHEAQVNG